MSRMKRVTRDDPISLNFWWTPLFSQVKYDDALNVSFFHLPADGCANNEAAYPSHPVLVGSTYALQMRDHHHP